MIASLAECFRFACTRVGRQIHMTYVLLFTQDIPSGTFASNLRPPQLCARFLEINGSSCRIGLDLQGVVPLVLQSVSKQCAVHVCINYSYNHRRRTKYRSSNVILQPQAIACELMFIWSPRGARQCRYLSLIHI